MVNQLNICNFRLHSSPSGELSPSHLLRKSPSPALTINCSDVSMPLLVKIQNEKVNVSSKPLFEPDALIRFCERMCKVLPSAWQLWEPFEWCGCSSYLIYKGISSSLRGCAEAAVSTQQDLLKLHHCAQRECDSGDGASPGFGAELKLLLENHQRLKVTCWVWQPK